MKTIDLKKFRGSNTRERIINFLVNREQKFYTSVLNKDVEDLKGAELIEAVLEAMSRIKYYRSTVEPNLRSSNITKINGTRIEEIPIRMEKVLPVLASVYKQK